MSYDLFRSIVEAVPDGVLVHRERSVVYANSASAQLLGRAGTDGLSGRSVLDVVAPRDRPALADQIDRVASGNAAPPIELSLMRADGAAVPVEATSRSLEDGSVATFVVDLTARKRAEETARRVREEFVAVVVHDLRDPVQTILMHTHALLGRVGRGEPVGPVNSIIGIQRSALRISKIAGDVLDFNQIELSRLALDRRLLNLPLAVAAVIDRLRASIGPHAIDLTASGDPPVVAVDPVRLEQILENLLDNAAKYSPAGSPIEVSLAPHDEGACITVRDHGTGIAADELPRIFERFYARSRSGERKGLGLGLTITKGLVEAQGGRVWVESELGRGSSFHLWFPAAATA